MESCGQPVSATHKQQDDPTDDRVSLLESLNNIEIQKYGALEI